MSYSPGIGGESETVEVVSTKTPLTASTPANFTVTGTSQTAVALNTSRKGLVIVNLSTTDTIFIGLGTTALINKGIALTQLGSVYQMSEYDYTTSTVTAISSGTSSVISIQEFQ